MPQARHEIGDAAFITTGNAKGREVLGEDPYAKVLGDNEKRTWAALNRYRIEQGLLKTMLPLAEFHSHRLTANQTTLLNLARR